MNYVRNLLIFAFFVTLIWVIEVYLISGWAGMAWQDDWLYSMAIIPVLSLIWVIWINRKIQIFKHLIAYPILLFTYLSYFAIYLLVILEEINYPSASVLFSTEIVYPLIYIVLGYLFLFTFPVITTLWNIIFARFENKKLSKRNLWMLFFSTFLIPVISVVLTILVFSQSYLFPEPHPKPFIESLVHWLKSGSLIFTFIIYEGVYYLWLKGKIEINFFSIKSCV
jgi:hypothetical protein